MLDIHINNRGQDPIYRQISDQIKQLIANSQLKPGTRMPTVRQLSAHLHLNTATVARAYQNLGQEGILGASRRRGTIVLGNTDSPQRMPFRQNRLFDTINSLILETLSLGYTPEELDAAFSLQLARWKTQREATENCKINVESTDKKVIRVIGSNDLAFDLLVSKLKYSNPEINVQVTPAGSLGGLLAIQEGKADMAGIHLLDEETGEYNSSYVQHTLHNIEVAVVHLADRIQGLIVAKGNPKKITQIEDLKRPDITFSNRQKGSGTRVWLDYKLRELGIKPSMIRGYDIENSTHLAVAMSILHGDADAGLGIQASAISCNLDFIPVTREKFGLVIPLQNYRSKLFEPLLRIIQSTEFKKTVNEMGGYDTADTGKTIFIKSN